MGALVVGLFPLERHIQQHNLCSLALMPADKEDGKSREAEASSVLPLPEPVSKEQARGQSSSSEKICVRL